MGPQKAAVMISIAVISFGALATWTAGFWLGVWARDNYWVGKASSVTRACARGKLYRVTEEP
jgi:hypothetical protein